MKKMNKKFNLTGCMTLLILAVFLAGCKKIEKASGAFADVGLKTLDEFAADAVLVDDPSIIEMKKDSDYRYFTLITYGFEREEDYKKAIADYEDYLINMGLVDRGIEKNSGNLPWHDFVSNSLYVSVEEGGAQSQEEKWKDLYLVHVMLQYD